uniref:EF-hand domain-containing protein n=1 Tax=Clytia hemisphaerica TaxID=252671 RepID=A0A7M6DMP8_9CNID
MYKWYDFHENGIVSKQDVNRLMDSICNVVTNSLTSDHQKHNNMQSRDRKCSSRDRKSSLTAPNNLKVHLEISQRRRRKSANQNEQYVHTREPLYDVDKIQTKRKAYNKYCAARKYNDLIFPPPNSEEAEKVSTYIEEKILKHRRFNVSSDAKPSRTSYRDIKQNSKKTTCSRCTKSHDLNEHSRRKHHHHHISESDTHTHPPRRRSEREKRYHNAGVLVTTQTTGSRTCD